jgi:hypothetical protein
VQNANNSSSGATACSRMNVLTRRRVADRPAQFPGAASLSVGAACAGRTITVQPGTERLAAYLIDYWEQRAKRVRPCTVPGCAQPRRAHGLCRHHLYAERGE